MCCIFNVCALKKNMSPRDTAEIRIRDGKAMEEKKMDRERRKTIQKGIEYSIRGVGGENGKQEMAPG